MRVIDLLLGPLSRFKANVEHARLERRWRRLRAMGMHIGVGVNLPASTSVDESHCFLISIGDYCGFGTECYILAHDAQMNEYLDITRVGRVIIHPSCHIGSRTVILPGVEIGPRTIVGSNSVVSRSLPPNTVCAGAPAKVLCSLDEYLERHTAAAAKGPTFPFATHDINVISEADKIAMRQALAAGDGYITGGYSAMMKGQGGPTITRPDGPDKALPGAT